MHVTWNGYSKSQQLAIEGNLKKTINYDGIASNANNPPPPWNRPTIAVENIYACGCRSQAKRVCVCVYVENYGFGDFERALARFGSPSHATAAQCGARKRAQRANDGQILLKWTTPQGPRASQRSRQSTV